MSTVSSSSGILEKLRHDVRRLEGFKPESHLRHIPILKPWSTAPVRQTYNYPAVNTLGGLRLTSIAGPYTNDTLGDLDGWLSGLTISGGNEIFGYDAINRHVTPLGTFTNTYLGETDQITSRSVTNGSITATTSWGYDTSSLMTL